MQSLWGGSGGNSNSAGSSFFDSFNASDFMEKARVAATKAADAAKEAAEAAAEAANKVAESAQEEYRRTFDDVGCEIHRVRPEVLIVEFPSEEKIQRISAVLNSSYAERMLVFNMSEKKYNTTLFQGEVVDVEFRGLPAPPLEMLMELCLSAQNWLASDPEHVLIVHCFQGFSRSIAFSSCFLAFRGFYAHPLDALPDVCGKVGLQDNNSVVLLSQRRYLNYFHQCLQGGVTPRPGKRRLLRATLFGVPAYEPVGGIFRPVLEIWSQGQLVYSSTPAPSGSDAGKKPEATLLPQAYNSDDPCAAFQLPAEVVLSGDILVRVRHVHSNGARDTAFRLAFNTGLIPETLHLTKQELDGASEDDRFPKDFFIDLVFEVGSEDSGLEVPPVYEKARQLSQKLRLEEDERQKEAAKSAKPKVSRKAGAQKEKQVELEDFLKELDDLGTPEDNPVQKEAPSSAPGKSSDGSASVAGEAKAVGKAAAAKATPATTAAPRVLSAPKTSAAKAPAQKESSSKEIDDLFGEFDVALASASRPKAAPKATTTSSAAKATSSAPPAAKAAQVKPASATKKAAATDNIFGEVDDFLKELEG
mmetsp:Transcript_76384/g.181671  ORF Transcript_76384/g.181671 Transcript_76384/m.181671 type:complete len:588 (-) Transcript_76384:209-1972(-)